MHGISKLIALAALLLSMLACSLFTGRTTPTSTPPKPTIRPTATQLALPSEIPVTAQVTSASPSQPTNTKVAPKAASPTPTLAGRVDTGPTQVPTSVPPTIAASVLKTCLDALPTNMPTVEQMVTSGNNEGAHPLVLCDNFADNSNGWNLGDWNGKYVQGTESLANGALHWQGIAPDGGVWYDFSQNAPTLTDFAVVVSARILDGPPDTAVGIFYRSDGDQFYLFEVTATQYDLYIFYNDNWEQLIAPKPVPAGFDLASKDGWIVVDVVGDLHTFYLDNEQVDTYTDSRLTSGQVGVGMDLATDPNVKGDIEYDHFVLHGQ